MFIDSFSELRLLCTFFPARCQPCNVDIRGSIKSKNLTGNPWMLALLSRPIRDLTGCNLLVGRRILHGFRGRGNAFATAIHAACVVLGSIVYCATYIITVIQTRMGISLMALMIGHCGPPHERTASNSRWCSTVVEHEAWLFLHIYGNGP
jgi:hypothetical protein